MHVKNHLTAFIARSMQVATAAEETIAILLSVSDAHRCMAVLVRFTSSHTLSQCLIQNDDLP
jgi:hypothetical protein